MIEYGVTKQLPGFDLKAAQGFPIVLLVKNFVLSIRGGIPDLPHFAHLFLQSCGVCFISGYYDDPN